MKRRSSLLALLLAGHHLSEAFAATDFRVYYLPFTGAPPADFPIASEAGDVVASIPAGADDWEDGMEPVDLPFQFPFFGDRFETLFIGANGHIQFTDRQTNSPFSFGPSVDVTGNILPFYTDLIPRNATSNSSISYTVNDDSVDIFFTEVPLWNCFEFQVSFTVRLAWTGRIQLYYRDLPPPATSDEVLGRPPEDQCRLSREATVVGIVPPVPDARLLVSHLLTPDQLASPEPPDGNGTITTVYYAAWTARQEAVYIERLVDFLNETNLHTSRDRVNAGAGVLNGTDPYWDLCPVSNSVCINDVSAAPLSVGGDALVDPVSGNLTFTFGELGCDPADLELKCQFYTAATDETFTADLVQRSAIVVDVNDTTALFNRQIGCAFPTDLRFNVLYNVSLVYTYVQGMGFSEVRTLPGSPEFAISIDATGENSEPSPAACDACGVADSTANACFGACGPVYSKTDCDGGCTFEFVEDSEGVCCELTCIGACANGAACCLPLGCDGVCGTFALDDTCFELSAEDDVVGVDVEDLDFFQSEDPIPFQVSTDGLEGRTAVVTLDSAISVELDRPVFSPDVSFQRPSAPQVSISYNVSRADGFEIVTNAPVNITGPAVVNLLAELRWPNATTEADLTVLVTSGTIDLAVAQAGGYPALQKEISVSLLMYLREAVCDLFESTSSCGWAPGCILCGLVTGGRKRTPPLSRSRRLSSAEGSSVEAGAASGSRKLSLGVFPVAIVADPEDEVLSAGICLSGLGAERCDDVLLAYEAGDIEINSDAR